MAISLSTEAAKAGNYPSNRFNQRERKLLESTKQYVDGLGAITATHKVVAGGSFTSANDASSPFTNTTTVAAALATDLVFAIVKTTGATPVSVTAAAAGSGNITVTFSGNPSTDHVINYVVLRANS